MIGWSCLLSQDAVVEMLSQGSEGSTRDPESVFAPGRQGDVLWRCREGYGHTCGNEGQRSHRSWYRTHDGADAEEELPLFGAGRGARLVSRSRSFVEAVERQVSELPNRPRRCLDVVAPDIVMLPLRAGSKLGTLEGGSVAPGRVLPNGKRKQPNLDAASWNVGRATGDLVNFGAAGAKLFGKRVDARLVTHAEVVALVKKTSCCNLRENHFVLTLRALGMFDETSEAGRVKSGTNANAFAQAFGAWQTHV